MTRGASAECRSGYTPWDDAELRRAAHKAYHADDGYILLRLSWVSSWADQAELKRIAAGVFGERSER